MLNARIDVNGRILHARAMRARAIVEMTVAALEFIAVRWARIRAGWRLRGLREDLYRQSDHLLRDIGLRRSQIDALFR